MPRRPINVHIHRRINIIGSLIQKCQVNFLQRCSDILPRNCILQTYLFAQKVALGFSSFLYSR